MTVQFSTAVRNAMLDAIESAIGVSAVLKFRTGAQPSDCAAADTGTVVGTLNLPVDYMSAASGGGKAKLGTWEDASADVAGTIGHFRLYAVDGTTCGVQGSVTITAGGGDLTVDNPIVGIGQKITVTAFNVNAGNA